MLTLSRFGPLPTLSFLANLKMHRQGLMQQLLPAVEEGSGTGTKDC